MAKKSEFQRVKDHWYEKLAESGFKDIEYSDGSIQSCLPRTPQTKDPEARAAIQEYYYMCYHFLHEHQFKNEREKIIWEYHTNGISVRNIAALLNQVTPNSASKSPVWTIVNELEKIMKARYLSVYGNNGKVCRNVRH